MKIKNSIFEIKKYLNKKGFIVKKKKKLKIQDTGLDNISRTFLSSLIIISIFFITPLAINLTKEKIIFSKDYENNSKNNLKKLLENKITKLDKKILERLPNPGSCILSFFVFFKLFITPENDVSFFLIIVF